MPPTTWRASTSAQWDRIDNGIVAVTTLWANEARYYPLHVMPYTPKKRLAGGKHDPCVSHETGNDAGRARAGCRRCVWHHRGGLLLWRQPFPGGGSFTAPPALCAGAPRRGWAPADANHSFKDAVRSLPLRAWREVIRRFRGGHTERWWAAELTLFGYGPGRPVRAVCATTDRRALPELSTWYLTTNLPVPLAEIVRITACATGSSRATNR